MATPIATVFVAASRCGPITRAMGCAVGESYVQWYGKGRAQNWRTPRSLFDPLNDEYGFTMDGASEPGNGLVEKASTAENPLSWEGELVFCNPPWSNIKPFVELAATADLAVLLVPARTNARWFHHARSLGADVRYFPGRVKFERPDGSEGTGHNSPVDCVLLVFDKAREREIAA
jgi:phage N-6-adenine-methyltransferase